MRKIFPILSLILLLMLSLLYTFDKLTFAASPSPEPEPAVSGIIEKLKKIEDLKEKIATKVAELREREKAAVSGMVKKTDDSSITLTTVKGDQTVSFLDDAVFYSLSGSSKKEIKSSSLSENNEITIFGYFDEGKSSLSAKYIYIENKPLHLFGKIADVDKSNYTLTVKSAQGETVLDYEKTTKMYLYDGSKNVYAGGGFSKLKIGDTAHVVATVKPKKENLATANKIFVFSFAVQEGSTSSPSPVKSLSPTVEATSKPTTSPTPMP